MDIVSACEAIRDASRFKVFKTLIRSDHFLAEAETALTLSASLLSVSILSYYDIVAILTFKIVIRDSATKSS